MSKLWDFLKSLATEDDANSIPDPVRVFWLAGGALALLGVLTFLLLAIVSVAWPSTKFDMAAFGTGYGALLAGFAAFMAACGAALAMKTKSGA